MPIDRGVIDQQLQALGESPRWWEQRELRDLPSVLQTGEQIFAIARGKIGRPRWLRKSWLIVATERRLLCIRSARRSKWTQMEVAGNLFTRVTMRIGPFRGRVLVTAGGHTSRLLVPRADAYKLSAALSRLVPAAKVSTPAFRPTQIARRVIDHVLSLPAVALGPDEPATPPPVVSPDPVIDEQVESLEQQLDELRRQVDFLEQLLHQQHEGQRPIRQLQSE